MKAIAILGLVAAISAVYLMTSSTSDNAMFENYIATFQKSYSSEDEYQYRRTVFESNLNYINTENAKGHSYTLGVTKFADWTQEEFKKIMGYIPMGHKYPEFEDNEMYPEVNAFKDIDWTKANKVTGVKDQGNCGSCWAFSAVGATEALFAIKTKRLMEFSEQQLVDCDSRSYGCMGGEMFYAFQYYRTHGICKRTSYPYTAQDGTCHSQTCEADTMHIKKYELVVSQDPSVIHQKLALAPLSIGVSAGNSVWQHYTSGVVNDPHCYEQLDHGVLLTGYDSNSDSWHIKNSWGTGWGEKGYIRIRDNHAKGTPGICGINMEISRPLL